MYLLLKRPIEQKNDNNSLLFRLINFAPGNEQISKFENGGVKNSKAREIARIRAEALMPLRGADYEFSCQTKLRRGVTIECGYRATPRDTEK